MHQHHKPNRPKSRAFSALLFLLLSNLLIAPTFAIAESTNEHQQKMASTKVLFNPNTNNIEVMHRFDLHDAEHAVRLIFSKDADIIASDTTRETFTQYVAANFTLQTAPHKVAELSVVGYEIDGRYLWVYQEIPASKNITSITITHDALREVWPKQVNRVNIEMQGETKTLIFEKNIRELTSVVSNK